MKAEKNKTVIVIIFMIFAITVMMSVSCNGLLRKKGIRDTITMMQAYRLKLNLDSMKRCIPDNDTARKDTVNAIFRLVVYVDSTNCSPCILNKMHKWNTLIDKTRIEGNHVNYIFIFEPKTNQIEDAIFAVESSGLKNRVYLDTAYVFRNDNKFLPNDSKYHTMLINARDSIILVGNPKTNENVEKVFLEIINN